MFKFFTILANKSYILFIFIKNTILALAKSIAYVIKHGFVLDHIMLIPHIFKAYTRLLTCFLDTCISCFFLLLGIFINWTSLLGANRLQAIVTLYRRVLPVVAVLCSMFSRTSNYFSKIALIYYSVLTCMVLYFLFK